MEFEIMGLTEEMLGRVDASLLEAIRLESTTPDTAVTCYVDVEDSHPEEALIQASEAGWEAVIMPFNQILLTLPAGQLKKIFEVYAVRHIYDARGEMRAHDPESTNEDMPFIDG